MKKKNILIVEGITDLAFVKYVIYKNNNDRIDEPFVKPEENMYSFDNYIIHSLDGKDNLEKRLIHLKSDEEAIEKIGIILDADKDIKTEIKFIKDAIDSSKIDENLCKIFLTPNNCDTGNLETLLLSTIPEDNAIRSCFKIHRECLNKDKNIFPDALDKGEVYSFTMFSQEGKNLYRPEDSFFHKNKKEPGLWDIGHEKFLPISKFILSIIQ